MIINMNLHMSIERIFMQMFIYFHCSRGWKRDFRQDVKNGDDVPCWFIHNNGTGLIDGVHTDYIVSGLFKTI